jgi:prevent-host-death family protein
MLNLSQDIRSLTEFKRNTMVLMRQMKERKRPVVLTVNGKAVLVVQDAQSYQKLLEAADRLKTLSALQEAGAQSRRGEGISLGAFDKRMRKRHGISR